MRMVSAMDWEKNRSTVEDYLKILLSKEGKFYRAYNESAWLLKNFMCTEEQQRQRGDEKILDASHYITSKSDYVMLGFPLQSLSKFLINYTGAETLENGDIVANITSPFGEDTTVEQIQADYEQWKKNLPIKEKESRASSSKQANKAPEQQPTPLDQPAAATLARSGMFAILAQIISYPIENSTPQDNYQFLSRLKQQVVGLL